MRIIFSRKGFDSSSGGKPSPIRGGCPISLPIPASRNSRTTYGDLGLGELVHGVTKGKYGPKDLCHADPYFANGQCAFGQTGSAQGHLTKRGVGCGDVFLFFGLFTEEDSAERHHRIFGYMVVDDVIPLGSNPNSRDAPSFAPDHPHFIGARDRNNTIYIGPGTTCTAASPKLRLTQAEGPLGTWAVPEWLAEHGLTYHHKDWRWPAPGTLLSVARGQEFICDIGDDPVPRAWVDDILAEIGGDRPAMPADDEVIIAMLRQPRRDDPTEQRNDPFWEFGSFGITGCHGSNLLNPKKAHELEGKRIAFAQGGPGGIKLVYVTPPVSVKYHAGRVELNWSPADMPLTYESAPTLIDNMGYTDFPALLDEIGDVARTTPVGQFGSKFRSRRKPLPMPLGRQILAAFLSANVDGRECARQYTDCLPYLPPRIDVDRTKTYRTLSHLAGGFALPMRPTRRCRGRDQEGTVPHQRIWSPYRPTVAFIGTVAVGLAIIEMSEHVTLRYVDGTYVRETQLTARRGRYDYPHSWTTTRDLPSGRMRIVAYSPYGSVTWSKQWDETKPESLRGQVKPIVEAVEQAAVDLVPMIAEAERQAEIRHQEWLAQQERWRREEDRRSVEKSIAESTSELRQVIEQWADTMRIERFLAGVEQRAELLPQSDKLDVLERLALAREFLGSQDPLDFFKRWKTPDERYIPQYSGAGS
ncbi:MAG: hypothetical protein ABIQ81_02565 [Novosphingobium sp.]